MNKKRERKEEGREEENLWQRDRTLIGLDRDCFSSVKGGKGVG